MFEARLSDGVLFKQIIEAIKDLVTDANMDVSEDEITIHCMDSSHVSLVDVSLQHTAFDQFHCDTPLSLGFSPPLLSKIFEMMKKGDILVLKAEDDGDTLSLQFESTKRDRTTTDFNLKLMDIEREDLGLPDTPYKCSVRMPSTEFQRIIRDLQFVGDTCTISCSHEGVRFSVSGETGTLSILTRANKKMGDKQVEIDVEEPVDELHFPLRYLDYFTKATPLSGSVFICLSPDVPVLVEYPIEEVGHVKFFLAPKVDVDGVGGEQ